MRILYPIFHKLLSPAAKCKFVLLISLSVIAAILETLGVSLVLPYISSLNNAEAFLQSSSVQVLCRWIPLNSDNVVYVLSGFLLFAFLVKNLYLWGLDVLKRKYVVSESFLAMKKVYLSYITKPYAYFLEHHSQDITNMIHVYVGRAFGVLQNMIGFFSEIVVTCLLVGLMMWVNTVITIVVFVSLCGILFFMKKPIEHSLKSLGKVISETHDNLTKSVVQSITGIREIKLLQQEDRIMEEFDCYKEGNVDAEIKQTVLLSFQNRVTEVVAIALILLCVLLCVNTELKDSLFATLTLVVMILMRIRPGLSRIFHFANHLSLCMPSLNKLNGIIHCVDISVEAPMTKPLVFQHSIEVKGLNFSYDGKQQVLKNVNMSIPRGSVIGLKGMSGGGKTTFANVLLGLLRPDAGCVLVDGVDVHQNCAAWFPLVSYIPQDIFLLDSTIRENVAFYRDKDEGKVWEALEKAQLRSFVENLPEGLDTKIGEKGMRLSGGQRQRLGIARAVYQDAQVFIFDEPTAALDEALEKNIMDVVFSLEDRTIILIAHRLNTLSRCDRIYEVGENRIQEDVQHDLGD